VLVLDMSRCHCELQTSLSALTIDSSAAAAAAAAARGHNGGRAKGGSSGCAANLCGGAKMLVCVLPPIGGWRCFVQRALVVLQTCGGAA